jgi:hypothetical protein
MRPDAALIPYIILVFGGEVERVHLGHRSGGAEEFTEGTF